MTDVKRLFKHFSFAFIPFLLFLGATIFSYFYFKQRREADLKTRFNTKVSQAEEQVKRRANHYIQVLKGAKALFTASSEIKREEWKNYIEALEVYKSYPGIQGIGFSEVIRPENLQDHIRQVRAEGFPDYTVTPAGNRPVYTAIVYIEPFTGRNLRAFGFDMFSEPIRRQAMEQARDTGQPVLSRKVILVQEDGNEVQPGFLLYLPVYQHEILPPSVADRRRLLKGYVYSPFRAGDLMKNVLSDDFEGFAIQIYDGLIKDGAHLLYSRNPNQGPVRRAGRADLSREIKINLANNTWTVVFTAQPAFTEIHSRIPEIMLVGGTVISLLIFFAFWSVATRRRSNKVRQTITDNATGALFMMNEKGYCTFMNPAAEAMTGFTMAEIQEKPLHYLIHHHRPDGTPYPMEECPIDRALPTNNLVRAHQDVFIRKDGTYFPVTCAASPIFQNGIPIATVIEVKDLTEEKKTQAALEYQHRVTNTIAENATVALFMMNADGYCTFMNPMAEEMTGFSFAEMQQQPLHNLIHRHQPDGAPFPMEECPLCKALKENKVLRGHEDVFIRKNGTFFNVSCSATPVFEQGTLAYMVLEIRDVTEERQAQSAILESEARFRNMADNAPVMIWLNNEEGLVTYLNRRWFEFTGKPNEASLDEGWVDPVHPDDVEKVRLVYEQALQDHTSFEVDYRLKRKDGVYRWMVTNAAPRFDAAGKFMGYIGSVIDITERKEAEQKIKENAALLQKIFQEVPALVALIRAADQTYIFANPFYRKMLGNQVLPGKSVREAHPDLEGPGLFEQIGHVISTGKAFVGKEVAISKEIGGKRQTGYFNLVYQPLFTQDREVDAVLVFAIEVTELVFSRKELMQTNEELSRTNVELRRTNTDLDNFVYTASHDLRAPIANLEGLTNDMMYNMYARLTPEEQFVLKLLRESINKLKRTIVDLTNITRVQKEVNQSQVNLSFAEVLADVKQDIQSMITESGACFKIDFAVPEIIYARKNLRSILYNLVSNAIKYRAPERKPQILVSTSQEGEYITLTVSDNGLGIRTDQQHKLFSMFRRVHTHVEGSGIGLYIVKRIVENNGGYVAVESQEGKGSTFKVFFKTQPTA
ncbi:MAG: CHASE domain-containing protein [Adhaeribacter sp.]